MKHHLFPDTSILTYFIGGWRQWKKYAKNRLMQIQKNIYDAKGKVNKIIYELPTL